MLLIMSKRMQFNWHCFVHKIPYINNLSIIHFVLHTRDYFRRQMCDDNYTKTPTLHFTRQRRIPRLPGQPLRCSNRNMKCRLKMRIPKFPNGRFSNMHKQHGKRCPKKNNRWEFSPANTVQPKIHIRPNKFLSICEYN